jgi:hypothetical protein
MRPYGKHRAALGPHLLEASAPPCCRSSVVEHPLGNFAIANAKIYLNQLNQWLGKLHLK